MQHTSSKLGKRQNRFSAAFHHDTVRIIGGNKVEDSTILHLPNMAMDDSSEHEGSNKSSDEEEAESPDDFSSREMHSTTIEKKNSTTKRLLTVPLFIKFVAVLLIKFITDLVVFPALFLYRMAHNAKRRLLRLFKKGATAPLNGDNTTS
jgi:hypothetical protein